MSWLDGLLVFVESFLVKIEGFLFLAGELNDFGFDFHLAFVDGHITVFGFAADVFVFQILFVFAQAFFVLLF